MGEMTDMLLSEVLETESLRDDYACGPMLEAYGVVKEEDIQTAWDRHPVTSDEELDSEVLELSLLIESLRVQ